MKEQMAYWVNSAEHDLEVAETLFAAGKYDWCLFIAHLVLEKILKACYVKQMGEFPPRTHDLVRLADMAGLELEDETLDFLDTVNTFNISTRYPDEKLKFYKMCTHEFASENYYRIKEVRKWLLKELRL